ncbi:MAG: DegT/DnrJ/EryC1/StrS family aminotransferase, partial [Desulfobacula sp.]|nr:DegT/DnrJ/EryC1/StrS family aminotransferase [Desulfobacula sp.]
GIHYPIPIHLQPCAKYLDYKIGDFPNVEKQSRQILSLPIHNGLNDDDIEYVADKIIEFFNSN